MLAGAPLAGLLVAWLGPLPVLVVNSATFLVSAAVVAAGDPARLRPTDHVGTHPAHDDAGYWASFAAGLYVLWRNRLLRAVALRVLVTNALDIGRASVIMPVYAQRELDGATSLGLLVGASGFGALVGALLFSVVGPRLPRRATFAAGFLLAGGPLFGVLALRPGSSWRDSGWW